MRICCRLRAVQRGVSLQFFLVVGMWRWRYSLALHDPGTGRSRTHGVCVGTTMQCAFSCFPLLRSAGLSRRHVKRTMGDKREKLGRGVNFQKVHLAQ